MNILYIGKNRMAENIFFSSFVNYKFGNLILSSNKQKDYNLKTNKIYQYSKMNELNFIDIFELNKDTIIKIIKENNIELIFCIGHEIKLSSKVINFVKGKAFYLEILNLPQFKDKFVLTNNNLKENKLLYSSIKWFDVKSHGKLYLIRKSFKLNLNQSSTSISNKMQNNCIKISKQFIDLIKRNKFSKNRISKEINTNYSPNFNKKLNINLKKKNLKDEKLFSICQSEILSKIKMEIISEKSVKKYSKHDKIKKILEQNQTNFEKNLHCQKWLKNDLPKRYTYFKNYYDLLNTTHKKILDIGGALTTFTRLLCESHDYTLCEILNFNKKKELEKFKNLKILNGDWINQKFQNYDLIISNDLFPNADQRLELFLIKALPHCKTLRFTLTVDNDNNYYVTKRIDQEEILTLKRVSGENLYNLFLKFNFDLNHHHYNKLVFNRMSLWNNNRQVFFVELKGFLK